MKKDPPVCFPLFVWILPTIFHSTGALSSKIIPCYPTSSSVTMIIPMLMWLSEGLVISLVREYQLVSGTKERNRKRKLIQWDCKTYVWVGDRPVFNFFQSLDIAFEKNKPLPIVVVVFDFPPFWLCSYDSSKFRTTTRLNTTITHLNNRLFVIMHSLPKALALTITLPSIIVNE